MPVTDPTYPMQTGEREAAHKDIGEIGASPHVDVTDNQPVTADPPDSLAHVRHTITQLNLAANTLDLHGRLHALTAAVNALAAAFLAQPHGPGNQG